VEVCVGFVLVLRFGCLFCCGGFVIGFWDVSEVHDVGITTGGDDCWIVGIGL